MEKEDKRLDKKVDLAKARVKDTSKENKLASKSSDDKRSGSEGSKSKSAGKKTDKKSSLATADKSVGHIPRLLKLYNEQYVKELQKELELSNILEVPSLTKIVLNMGVGEAANDRKHIEKAEQDLSLISGQKPIRCYAKISESGFKLRAGIAIGVKVTLRSKQMYEFLDRLVTIAMPRIRDFQSLNNKSFDGFGNFAFGIKEQIIFPEINYDTVDKIRGFDVVICTTSNNDLQAKALLEKFNMPFRATN